MTFPPPGGPAPGGAESAPRQRPATVTVASVLMWVIALVSLISTVLAVAQLGDMEQQIRDQMAQEGLGGTELDSAVSMGMTFGYIAMAAYALFAIAFAILGYFVFAGRNGARITTWVLAVLYALCGVCGLFGLAVEPDAISLITTGITFLGSLAVIILLALPPSNEYFRKPTQEWTPPPGM